MQFHSRFHSWPRRLTIFAFTSLLAACGGSSSDDPVVAPPPVQAVPTISVFAGSLQRPGGQDGIGVAAQFSSPEGVAQDTAGNVFVADPGNHTIRRIAPNGVVTTVAGAAGQAGSSDGTGAAARFASPRGIAV